MKRARLLTLVSGGVAIAVVILLALNWQTLAAHWRFWRLFESIGTNAQGYPEYRHRQTGIVMVRVPAGTFMMGSSADDEKQIVEYHALLFPQSRRKEAEDGVAAEFPQHRVTLAAFLIAKYEVTQRQWRDITGVNPSEFKGDDMPVERVSWHDCRGFCTSTGLSLPTEAQWEYACRGGNSDWQVGDLDALAWHSKNSGRTSHPVGQKAPNAIGLHDVYGNVYEWCQDTFDKGFYSQPEAAGPDPVCTSESRLRVCRGGGWFANPAYSRPGFRHKAFAQCRDAGYGFRPAYYPLP